jgi:hypothetical protein
MFGTNIFNIRSSKLNTQERLDDMTRVSSSLTKVLGSILDLGMQQL